MGTNKGIEHHCDICGKIEFIASQHNGLGFYSHNPTGWITGTLYGQIPFANQDVAICPGCVKKIGLKTSDRL